MSRRLRSTGCVVGLALTLAVPVSLQAQDQRDEQFYYPGSFNWQFLKTYPEAARLFNAFDYGHAVLYERLYTQPGRAKEALDKEFVYLTTNLLVQPPRFAVAEEAIEPSYAKLAWRAKQMFDWAHILHRQIYDAYADERLTMQQKDSLVERLTDYYLSRKDYAFAPVPKSMSLMDDQYFSQVFRREYPKFNGLIWAYHWLQVGLYEPLIAAKSKVDKKAALEATVARFWSMLEDPPHRFPKVMPMTAAVAPLFSQRHPRAAAIFDNLHMTHDIISDVLAADTIARDQKRAMIYAQLAKMQDATREVMAWDEWRMMGDMMGGVGVMGGPAIGLLPEPPTAGTPAAAMDAMGQGMGRDGTHEMPDTAEATTGPQMDHAMTGMRMQPRSDSAHGGPDHMAAMMELHERMMSDSVIRTRVLADTAMRRMMSEMMDRMPAEHRAHMEGMMRAAPGGPATVPAKSRTKPSATPPHGHHGHETADTTGPRPAPKPRADSMPGMKDDSMPGMKHEGTDGDSQP